MSNRRKEYSRRTRREERLEDGQDSFLDVVSNLVGVLIILIMVAGARVRNAASEIEQSSVPTSAVSTKTVEERRAEAEYVAAVGELEELSQQVAERQREAEESSRRAELVGMEADEAERRYQELVAEAAGLDALFEAASREKSDAEKESYDLRSAIYSKEKRFEELKREKEALVANRPQATLLENIPTPISKRVADGHEGYFCLKNGRLSHVPLNEFQERVMLKFKSYRGDMTPGEMEEKIGPVENYVFNYFVELGTRRTPDGETYYFEFKYGECTPTSDVIGEPVDEALENRNSVFRNRLMKYVREDTTITIFIYPDSFGYLNDVKKFLFSLGYMTALRPLPDGVPITISPYGTASSTY